MAAVVLPVYLEQHSEGVTVHVTTMDAASTVLNSHVLCPAHLSTGHLDHTVNCPTCAIRPMDPGI